MVRFKDIPLVALLLGAEGFVLLSIQVLFFRQLTPHVGASNVITSVIIGFLLFAMCCGYYSGAKLYKKPLNVFATNFMMSSLLASMVLSPLFLDVFFSVISPAGLFMSLFVYCMIAVIPIGYWLGQSLPLLIQSMPQNEHSARTSSKALIYSTAGNVVGSIGTAVGLNFLIGALGSLFVSVTLAFFVSLYVFTWNKILKLLALSVFIMWNYIWIIQMLLVSNFHSTAYQDVVVESREGVKTLIANKLHMSQRSEMGGNSFWYIDAFKKIVHHEYKGKASVLVLGAGGYMAHDEQHKDLYTYVEIDPSLPSIVGEHFNKGALDVKTEVSDARTYLLKTKESFDVIFLDVYSGLYAIPTHLVTQEFFLLLKRRLSSNGVMIANTVIRTDLSDQYSQRIHATIMSSFSHCYTLHNPGVINAMDAAVNVLYVCKENTAEVYVDDRSTADVDAWSFSATNK